ncbi:SH3 domain-containing protein [Oricola sp.]|uniref:SH3 domain-containing protein n=1 Tax=Oricola sp. TaxID=1979950 RepID=UPI003BABBE5B
MGSEFGPQAVTAMRAPVAQQSASLMMLLLVGFAGLVAGAWGTVLLERGVPGASAAASGFERTAALIREHLVLPPAAAAELPPTWRERFASEEPGAAIERARSDQAVAQATADLAVKLALNKDKLKILPAGSTRFAGEGDARSPSEAPRLPQYFARADAQIGAETTGGIRAADALVAPTGGVAVAETEADVRQMEQQMERQMEGQLAAISKEEPVASPAEKPAPEVAAAESQPPAADDGMRPAQADKWVNMRVAPRNKSRVLTVVPSGADIMAETDCRHWCKVIYDGREGYIYKTFIR